MKNLKFLMLAALMTPALAADPGTLKQYQTLQQAYYQLNPGSYKNFTCHVDVSSLDASVAELKQTAQARPANLQVKENLADYALTVDHAKGIAFIDPAVDIVLLSEKGIPDPTRVKLGIDQSKQGFTRQVQGADQTISGVFDSLFGKVPDLTSVARDGDRWTVKYMRNGIALTDMIEGPRLHEEGSMNGVDIVADSEFMPLSGSKLALQDSDIQMTQGPQHMTTSMTVSYQKLGMLQIPSVITDKIVLDHPGLGQTVATVTITLQPCTIKD